MQMLASAVKIVVELMLTSKAIAAPTPTTIEVMIGIPVRGDTLARNLCPGSAFSRAIEYIIRAPDVWHASMHANTATATQHSSSRPSTSPKRSCTTQARPNAPRLPSVRLGAAIRPPRMSSPPPTPDVVTARMIVFGVVLRGECVSSASSPAESNPTIT